MSFSTPEQIAINRKELGIPDELIPQSIAIIMDGNGRWATERDLPRPFGHKQGATVVREIVRKAASLDLDNLTLYSFSQQNWARPKEEVDALMHLYAEYLIEERKTVMDNNVRLRHIGLRDGLPDMVLRELDISVEESSKNTGMYLSLALNYGGREEIVDATKRLAGKAVAGVVSPEDISVEMFANSLDTAGTPDPDLLIRTAGEMRISNYLLWQISYSEFYVTDKYWPDFTGDDLCQAMLAYAKRDRRFGGLNDSK